MKLLILKGNLVIKSLTNNSNIKHAQYLFTCIRFPGGFSSMRNEKSPEFLIRGNQAFADLNVSFPIYYISEERIYEYIEMRNM